MPQGYDTRIVFSVAFLATSDAASFLADPGLTAPELWLNRTLLHAADAIKYGVGGLSECGDLRVLRLESDVQCIYLSST